MCEELIFCIRDFSMRDIDKRLTPYQWLMAAVSVISIFLIILDFAAVINIDQPTSKWFWINAGLVLYLAIDYFYHLKQAKDKKKFFKTHIYDLLSIIPMGLLFVGLNVFSLSGLVSDLRLLRLIRLAGLMGKLREIFHTDGLLYVIFFTITFLLLGAEAFAITEHVSLDTAFWWVISTASTVGYDAIFGKTIPPHSIVGKFVTLIMMLLGIGIVGMLTSSITSYLVKRTNGAKTLETHDNIEKQNKDLTDQNKKMQAEIETLKAEQNSTELQRIKDWFEKKKG